MAGSLKRTNGRSGASSYEASDYVVAAPLTKGSATGEGVNPPGRRQEDDVNLVVADTVRSHPRPGSNSSGALAFHVTQDPISGDVSPAMGKGNRQGAATIGVQDGQIVRRLTPTECERLQGFPDGWTRLNDRTPDSRRYSALGDAVTVTVAHWIGQRLVQAEASRLEDATHG